jgi:1-pyrroline-5-carboxylate dehydrogenase
MKEASMIETRTRAAPGKITYATISPEGLEEIHAAFDEAIPAVEKRFGEHHPMFIGGKKVFADEEFEDRSPIDARMILGCFQKGMESHVRDAINAARGTFPKWSATPWRERVALMRKVGDLIKAHRWELGALIAYEAGKNRMESLGDVEESSDFISYYCDQMEAHNGFVVSMGKLSEDEENISVLRPYGVWAVIAPFNFPLALATGPMAGALITGNTVVFKPATDTPFIGLRLYEITAEAGLPPGVFNIVTGGGSTVGRELVENTRIDGVVFTGSREIGMQLAKLSVNKLIPRPVITEMGGKNPAIIMKSADLEKATEGVVRSAFGAQGQKCSACSRVYVANQIRHRFMKMLVEKTKKIKIGNPLERDVWLGPVINEAAVRKFEWAIDQARKDGGRILIGGRRLTEEPYNHGYFVEPTVIDGLPKNHPLFFEELFVPIAVVADVATLDEAIDLANQSEYGLTAGIFSEDEGEVQQFFDRVEAGVVYANRRVGITTGAWPGINPFGGWKASGSTGRGAGGPYYVQQFLREQSRVRIH